MNNDDINSRIARAMGFDTIMVDLWGIGEKSLYIYDPSAKHTGEHTSSVRLVGGGWEKTRNDNGEPFEFYGRPCPNWSGDWRDTGQLLENYNIFLLHVKDGFIAEDLQYRPNSSQWWLERPISDLKVFQDPKLAICFAWLAEYEDGGLECPKNM